ncbi:SRPBCC family protein [Paradevosia shaoguanensis]|uniref:SRPBCC family protein n=1 Tax=Paradevosia shaoguanensis TaxID=1335043 RepID=A0AA41UHM7_9HYPH|nr:SRPBCC family protein [Paradevosia shaoguanensis]MCF1744003.1 SRPBCC family protein [Paradevosia shaoguanensis]MCI0128486.1 SRPBCC family protein [Paradevosia shaoguanensis]
MTERSIAYGTFVIERTLPVPPARVFAAWADVKQKAKWFGAPGGDNTPKQFDFRVGGREYNEGEAGGTTFTFDVLYQDIVENERIIYTYDMTMNGARISVSLASVELRAEGSGTRLLVTEHGAYLDGLDNNEQRKEGTIALIGQLEKYLKAA